MDKNVEISMLLDYYAPLLTDKQKNITDLYYNCDYSLGEIADNLEISRQGVRNALKRAESVLISSEERLGFAKRMFTVQSDALKIKSLAEHLKDTTDDTKLLSDIDNIIRLAQSLQKEQFTEG